jgi:hypothetical protein
LRTKQERKKTIGDGPLFKKRKLAECHNIVETYKIDKRKTTMAVGKTRDQTIEANTMLDTTALIKTHKRGFPQRSRRNVEKTKRKKLGRKEERREKNYNKIQLIPEIQKEIIRENRKAANSFQTNRERGTNDISHIRKANNR